MTKTTSMIAVVMGLVLGGVPRSEAQTTDTKGYVDVNLAGQTQSVTIATSSAVALFNEPATTSSSQTVGKGLVFDAGAGYRVWNDLAVGVALSLFSRSPTGTVSATVPSPILFGAFTSVTASPKLAHTEVGTHIKITYFARVNDKLEVAISGGPSFVHLTKEIAGATIANGTANLTVTTQTANAVGVNGGLEVNYRFMPRIGGGVFARYVQAEVDLPAASGVKVGGFQGGLGIRLHF